MAKIRTSSSLWIGAILWSCLMGFFGRFIYGPLFVSAETSIVQLNVSQTVLEIETPTTVSINLAPTNGGVGFASGSTTIDIGTNNATGYTLTMHTASYWDFIPLSTGSAPNDSTPRLNAIPFVSGGYTETLFSNPSNTDTMNKWGYKIGSGNYFPFNGDVAVRDSLSPSNSSQSTVTFAAKVDTSQPAGTYETTIIFTPVANPIQGFVMQDVWWWEDLVDVGETVQAIDSRDSETGKNSVGVYNVIKLMGSDGVPYLWMKDNLKLPAGTHLDYNNSDLATRNDTFDLPTEEWTSSSQNYYCKPIMKMINGDYYYNWYAATANPYSCSDPTDPTAAGSTEDAHSLGSICPAGWTLPTYNELTSLILWDDGDNPGGLTTRGWVDSGTNEGNYGSAGWWSSSRVDNDGAYALTLPPTTQLGPTRHENAKFMGYTVRCMRNTAQSSHDQELVFEVGEGIEAILVTDGRSENKFAPFYATAIHDPNANLAATVGKPVKLTNVAVGDRFDITVIPRPGYILSGWEGDTTPFASTTLLTTTYTANASSVPSTLTAVGVAGSYQSMQTMSSSYCTTTPTNVTDSRDGKSYTIRKFGSYCHMLSNLRLDSGITLTSADSNITPNNTYTSFTTPTEAWTSSSQDYYCKAIMKKINNEYYYNWYAAKANPYECDNPTANTNANSGNDAKSLGSICPKNWKLPKFASGTASIDPATLWGSGGNINVGMLATTGYFYSGSTDGLGSVGYWWSETRGNNNNATALHLRNNGTSLGTYALLKYRGLPVRCTR